MQDYPLLLRKNEKVGFTMYERWFCFSGCKNNLHESIDKIKKGLFPESAFSVEQDLYSSNTRILRELGCIEVEDSQTQDFVQVNGVNLDFWPKIFINPSFSVTLEELRSKFKGKNVVKKNSTLLLFGKNSTLENVRIDGLVSVDVAHLSNVSNENRIRLCFTPLNQGEGANFEQIRGYRLIIRNFD